MSSPNKYSNEFILSCGVPASTEICLELEPLVRDNVQKVKLHPRRSRTIKKHIKPPTPRFLLKQDKENKSSENTVEATDQDLGAVEPKAVNRLKSMVFQRFKQTKETTPVENVTQQQEDSTDKPNSPKVISSSILQAIKESLRNGTVESNKFTPNPDVKSSEFRSKTESNFSKEFDSSQMSHELNKLQINDESKSSLTTSAATLQDKVVSSILKDTSNINADNKVPTLNSNENVINNSLTIKKYLHTADEKSKHAICFNCGTPGHIYTDCLKPRKVFCHRCGFLGRKKAECPVCIQNIFKAQRPSIHLNVVNQFLPFDLLR